MVDHTSGGLSEIELLRARVAQLEQERDLAQAMLRGLAYLGQRLSFWHGTPGRLNNLALHIQQAFHYQAVALSLFETGVLQRRAVVPAHIPISPTVSLMEIEQAIIKNEPLALNGRDGHWLIVPLVMGVQRVGVIEIDNESPWTSSWIEFWRTCSAQIASLIVGGQLIKQLEDARRRHQLLYNITWHLTSGMNVDKVLTDILELAIPYIGADEGCVMLLDDQSRIASRTLVRQLFFSDDQQQLIIQVLEHSLARWVIDHRQVAVLADTTLDERWGCPPDQTFNVRSVLATPLLRGERIRGLFILLHHEPNYFTPDHSTFLTSIADQSAIMVENVILLEQTRKRVEELAALNEISEAVTSLYLDDILQIITERTSQSLQVQRCAVFLLDQTGTRLVLQAVSGGLDDGEKNLTVDLEERPHIAETIYTRRPVQVANVFEDERMRFFWERARQLDIKTQLAVPLVARQRVIGAMAVDRDAQHPHFTPGDIELCRTIAVQAANAIENARLYADVQRRAERMSMANIISHDIGAILDIDQLLWEVARLIRETFDCYHAAIALIEGDDLVFKSGINYLYQSISHPRISLKESQIGIVGWVAQYGRSLNVPDVTQNPNYLPIFDLSETRSELAVPLKVSSRTRLGIEGKDLVIGVLNVESVEVNAFSDDDQDLLEALAAQVSVAVENARLFSRVRQETATLEALVNGTSDAIIVTDTAERILFFNPAARQALERAEASLIGRPLREVIEEPLLLSLWDPDARTDRPVEIPVPDGRTLYASKTHLEGIGQVVIMQDITHLKEMDKMKSSFVSTVSHDLRSPLQVIQTSAELIPRLGSLNPDQRKEIDHILAVVRRITHLVQHLLDIGRIEAGVGMEVEPCAINEIIASAAGPMRALAEQKNIQLVIQSPKVLPLVRGNTIRLGQVISNLVSNAIKFTPQGSVTVSAWYDTEYLFVEVSDTGIGIPADAQEKLFQKFYRVKTPETMGIEGTGLGLAIVKSIVESYGGQISVSSAPRLGSTFTISLPIYQQDAQSPVSDDATSLVKPATQK